MSVHMRFEGPPDEIRRIVEHLRQGGFDPELVGEYQPTDRAAFRPRAVKPAPPTGLVASAGGPS